MSDTQHLEIHKNTAQNWFQKLRDDICASFERLEDDLEGSLT